MRISRLIALTALVAGLTLALVAPASGHIVRYGRSVSAGFIPSTGPPFTAVTGKVSSGKAACRRYSKVALFRNGAAIASRTTTRTGRFTIPSPGTQFEDGSYYLVVKGKVLANNRFHRHRCPRLKTNSFTITNP